jgi:hypothetical protein
MKADIARLERRFHAYDQAPRRRRERSLRLTDEAAWVHDPVDRAVLARWQQIRQAQTEPLQTRGACLQAAGVTDEGDGRGNLGPNSLVEGTAATGRLVTALVKSGGGRAAVFC